MSQRSKLATNAKKAKRNRSAQLSDRQRHLVAEGLLVAEDDFYKLVFDPQYPYTYCLLCGAVYQPPAQRKPVLNPQESLAHENAPNDTAVKRRARQAWSHRHASKHSIKEHRMLALSGRRFTPEAQAKLAPLGIVALTDIALSPEHAQAAREAPRISLPSDA